ncbi:MAG: carbamoyltransferase HypF [Anaerolineaceae bacterium]|nr:carbamoyltransferase HypF [Anaerolineaceae bacterium]
MKEASINKQIRITGIVQGVGFRPAVYALAVKHGLGGWVNNSSRGVEIEVSGSLKQLEAFIADLQKNPPPQARLESFDVKDLPDYAYSGFEIRTSADTASEFLPVASDLAVCEECKKELFEPGNRRYRYPFINCTHCGPRYSIIKAIPYDRPNTTMAGFSLCPSCKEEYHNPADRRFHAQPIACPVCGPQIWLQEGAEKQSKGEDALQQARQHIRQGKIIAVKGLGGFHLFCDAANQSAVERLRERKHRSGKPLALMGYSLEKSAPYFVLSQPEKDLLQSTAAPIVLLDPSAQAEKILRIVAPDQKRIGLMLAYTPLHLLLLEPAPDFPDLLVATSGNISEEPICYTQEEAAARLSSLADAFLMHDRPIHHAIDDSLTQIMVLEKPLEYPLRRARGLNTQPLPLPAKMQILGTGAELKNTFCLAREGRAFLSHHMGDLQNQETLLAYESAIRHDQELYRIQPELVSCDLHPDYLSSKFAEEYARAKHLPLLRVQHHHAHLAACLTENRLDPEDPVLGLIYDGTGLGCDGSIWGGEVLYGNCKGFERCFHLKPVPQPGADLATRQPARMAIAYLLSAGLTIEDTEPFKALGEEKAQIIQAQIRQGVNAPLTSSMGRLFDAASSLLGLYQQVSYEAQAAIALESLADSQEENAYPIRIEGQSLDTAELFAEMMIDLRQGTRKQVISARFHNAVAAVSLNCLLDLRTKKQTNKVVISGGVWQNHYLLKRIWAMLQANGFAVYTHHLVPANDACIALGQVAVALAQSRR